MKITYTGRQIELAPAQVRKIEARGAKLAKLLDGKGEREAHVTLAHERGRHTAEVTIQYFDHPLISEASNPDLFTAIFAAIDKLETQAVKVRTKRRDTKRTARQPASEAEAAPEAAAAIPRNGSHRVYRVSGYQGHKPMTLDEAILEMEKDRDYLVYRDAGRDRLSVLLRRRDGHFDLVEC
jgi:putative sigma-54 modulation protein